MLSADLFALSNDQPVTTANGEAVARLIRALRASATQTLNQGSSLRTRIHDLEAQIACKQPEQYALDWRNALAGIATTLDLPASASLAKDVTPVVIALKQQVERLKADWRSLIDGWEDQLKDRTTDLTNERDALRERLVTIVDEACGLQPVDMSSEALFTLLEKSHHDWRMRAGDAERKLRVAVEDCEAVAKERGRERERATENLRNALSDRNHAIAARDQWKIDAQELRVKQSMTSDEKLIVAWHEGLVAGQHTLGLNEDDEMPRNPYAPETQAPLTKAEVSAEANPRPKYLDDVCICGALRRSHRSEQLNVGWILHPFEKAKSRSEHLAADAFDAAAEEVAESMCPLCMAICDVLLPAEPDVGIAQPTYACKEHGEFFTDGDGFKGLVKDRTLPQAPTETP